MKIKNLGFFVFIMVPFAFSIGCSQGHSFTSGFETTTDFSGFYWTPQPHMGTATWSLQGGTVHSGANAFMGTITGVNPPGTDAVNTNNHRAYPTIQLHKSSLGVLHTPAMITLWVNLNVALTSGQWFSFATFVSDTSDTWNRTVLVNLDDKGYVNLMHTPYQEQGVFVRKNTTVAFPMNQWVKLEIYVDFTPDSQDMAGVPRGYAMVWQNGVLISSARVGGMNGVLAQAHFGVYAAPTVSAATLYNDDLTMTEVSPIPLQ